MKACPIKQTTKHSNKQDETLKHIFESKDDMQRSITRFCYGDLYIIGRLWTEALKAALVGGEINLFPVVEAAPPPPEPPKRPPPMKFKDLPLYQSPHHDYKTYKECQNTFPQANVKLLQQYLLPYVKSWRNDTANTIREAKSGVCDGCKITKKAVNDSFNNFKAYMRDPNILAIRQGVVAAGAVVGFMIGGSIPRRICFTGLGILATGSLCFPKETDEGFRNFLYHTSKFGLRMFNIWCGKNWSLRERVACRSDLSQVETSLKKTPTVGGPVKCPPPSKK